jgi:hypothetical protein
MSDSITERTPPVIAVEINTIKIRPELYENLDKTFKELAYEMSKFASLDPDVHAAYIKMV